MGHLGIGPMGRESLTDEVTDQESGVKVKDESIDGRRERERKRGKESSRWEITSRMDEKLESVGDMGLHVAAQVYTVLRMEYMVACAIKSLA